jgi:hypothetical protein
VRRTLPLEQKDGEVGGEVVMFIGLIYLVLDILIGFAGQLCRGQLLKIATSMLCSYVVTVPN